MFNIKNLAPDDLSLMLQVASPDEVYSFVASNLKVCNHKWNDWLHIRKLKLQLIAKQIKAITQHTPILSFYRDWETKGGK